MTYTTSRNWITWPHCVVNHPTSSNKYTTCIPGRTCNCGIPQVAGLPCQHMIAVCKSGCIDGLDESNVMPYWWHTSHWRKQYPQGISVGSNFSIIPWELGNKIKSTSCVLQSVVLTRLGTKGTQVWWSKHWRRRRKKSGQGGQKASFFYGDWSW